METLILFLLGAIVGSFLNVAIIRLPNDEGLGGRSHCPKCGRQLGILDLVPLASFLALRGKCRSCGGKISWRYFIVEAAAGLLFALAWQLSAPSDIESWLILARNLLAVSAFMVIFAIDLEHFLILDIVVFPVMAAAAIINFWLDAAAGWNFSYSAGYFVPGLAGALFSALPFFIVWYFSKGLWMGFGDVKLALLLGVLAGWPLAAVNIMLAVFLGGAFSVILLASGKKTLKSQVPFGTFLSMAGVLTLFFGREMLVWYLSFLGF